MPDARCNSTVTRDGLLANYILGRIKMKQGRPYPLLSQGSAHTLIET